MRESPRLRAFVALCVARLRETYREPEVLFWGFVFPLLLSGILAVAFRNRPPEPSRAVVLDRPGAAEVARALGGARLVAVRTAGEAEAARDLRMGRADVVVAPPAAAGGPVELRLDPTRPEAGVARARVDDALQRAAGRVDPVPTSERAVAEPGGRYVDFLVPGLVGMNLMNAGLWGVGYMLVDMRIKKLLRRLLATPMRPADFLLAQMTNRVAFTLVEVAVLLGFGRLALGVPVRGSLAAIAALSIAGSLAFAGLGLLIACRAAKIETVNGLMNLLTLPMWVGSGVFFSIERFPPAAQQALQLLPLTALIDALRAVTLEGATLASQGARIAVLAAWGILSFLVGLKLFRWS
ncbi:MAG: ABC transporter permease [Vicinamibacteria bacterium]